MNGLASLVAIELLYIRRNLVTAGGATADVNATTTLTAGTGGTGAGGAVSGGSGQRLNAP